MNIDSRISSVHGEEKEMDGVKKVCQCVTNEIVIEMEINFNC